MPKCKNCGEWGLFLKLNAKGYCETCEKAKKSAKNIKSIYDNKNSAPHKKSSSSEFDKNKELEILAKIKVSKNAYDRHFAFIEAQDFYYKYRNLNPEYLSKCIEYCEKDLKSLEQTDKDYISEQKALICSGQKYGIQLSDEDKKDIDLLEKYGFNAYIPAWKRMCIIYEKDNRYDDALSYCNRAIQHYEKHGCAEYVKEFGDRKNKILEKIAKRDKG